MISLLGTGSGSLSSPDALLFGRLLTMTTDPDAAAAALNELQAVITLANKSLDDARATIIDADNRTEAVARRETDVAERETRAAAKEQELAQRETDLAFRERHLGDLTRKAETNSEAVATLRSELEHKIATVRQIASA